MEISTKALVLQALLEKGNVYLHLDATRSGVEVPSHLKDDETLTLVVGPNLAIPIPDLEIGTEGLSATLSFSQTPFHCKIPWRALFAMSTEDGRSLVWAEDAPDVVREALTAEDTDRKISVDPSDLFGPLEGGGKDIGKKRGGAAKEPGPDRSRFGVVEGGASAAADSEKGEMGKGKTFAGETEGDATTRSAPHLHLVD